MDLSGIIAIAGSSGLFKMVAQARNGIIVESLTDGKRVHASASKRISSLEDISIYTTEEDLPLSDVMRKIFDKVEGKRTIEATEDPDKLRKYFKDLVPKFDEERVYNSDIKKVFSWYNLLHDAKMLKVKEEETEEKEEVKEGDDKAVKKAAGGKKAADKTESDAKKAKKPAIAAKPKSPKKPVPTGGKAKAKPTSVSKGSAKSAVKTRTTGK